MKNIPSVFEANGLPATHLFDPYGNDQHALEDWLSTKQTKSRHTLRAYKTAALSLRDWLGVRHNSTSIDLMIKITPSEANAFVSELFKQSSLKTASIKHKVVILSSMYDYWAKPRPGGNHIVELNPFDGIAKTLQSERKSNVGSQRALSDEEVSQVHLAIENLTSNGHSKHVHRAKLIWLLAMRLALRREEISNIKASDIKLSSSKRRWILSINGKGRHHSDDPDIVVIPDDVMRCIREYRTSIGLFPDPLPSEAKPLLHRLSTVTSSRPTEFMTPEHVARIMKSIFRMAAKDAADRLQNPAMEQRLLQASIHWGRHTWFMSALKKHPIHLVSLGGRHKDIRTTQKSYVSLTEDDLAKLAE